MTAQSTYSFLATYPLQAFLFANLINVFTFVGKQLTTKGNFWSLMFFIEAICVFIFYFTLGWASHLVSIVSSGSCFAF